MALPDPNPDWTAPERWAWERIAAGLVADFHARGGAPTPPLDPRQDTDPRWSDPGCALRPAFLTDVLARAPWCETVPFQGVRIAGACVDGDVDLAYVRLARQFWLESSVLRGALRGDSLRSDGSVSLEGSTVTGRVDLQTSRIDGDLFMSGRAAFRDVVNLSFADVKGVVQMAGAVFEKAVRANTIKVSGSMLMRDGAIFRADVDLTVAKVGQNVDLAGSTFEGALEASTLDVAGNLFMNAGAVFKGPVNLTAATIGRSVDFQDAVCEAAVNLRNARVSGSLFMRWKSTFRGALDIGFVKVGGAVEMSGSTFEGPLEANTLDVAGSLFMNAGAVFKGPVDLTAATIGHSIDLQGVICEAAVNLRNARVSGSVFMRGKATFRGALDIALMKVGGAVEMSGSTFEGPLEANTLDVAGTLFMNAGAVFKGPVELSLASIGINLDLAGVRCEGSVTLRNARVAGSVFMREKAAFKDRVDLSWARVGGSIELTGSTFEGAVSADFLEVTGSLFLNLGSEFKGAVSLMQARVDGQLNASDSVFAGPVSLESIRVGHDVFLRTGHFAQPIHAIFAAVGRNLDLSGSVLPGADLSSARIAGELRVGSSIHAATEWSADALLNLRGARAGAIQDRRAGPGGAGRDSWPARLELDGFAFERLGGFASDGAEADFAERESAWFAGWLARDRTYSPQPYVQLAEVLRRAGEPGKANDVLFAGRQRARAEAWRRGRYGTWAVMTSLRLAIGYGIGRGYANALLCVAAATLIGAAVLSATPEAAAKGWAWMIGASLDQLLPIVELNKEFGDFFNDPGRRRLGGWQLTYFAFQSLLGYVLGSFVVAGIAGLTQKP